MALKRNKFNLSHYHLLTCDMGKLVPCGVTDVLPGDTFVGSTSALVRMSPMVAPVMHPIEVRIHHWFVPYRLLWDEFEDFITGGATGMDTPAFPQVNVNNASISSLHDYFGIPTEKKQDLKVSALPYRAYSLIYNNFYRDQDLEQEISISYASGVDSTTNTTLQNVAWSKDYFTTARPWTQKGPEVTVPIGSGSGAPIVKYGAYSNGVNFDVAANVPFTITKNHQGSLPSVVNWASFNAWYNEQKKSDQFYSARFYSARIVYAHGGDADKAKVGLVGQIELLTGDSGENVTYFDISTSDTSFVELPNSTKLPVQSSPYVAASFTFSTSTAVIPANSVVQSYEVSSSALGALSVTDLRLATALQRMQEARAKYGSRYIDYLAYYGVKCSDSRLQLPEYLGGGKNLLQISEVLQTTPTADSYVGDMYGHGIMSMRSNRFKFFAEEHGVIISLMSVLPHNMYSDGVDRMWLKTTKDEFYQKELNAIGMQEIYNAELFVDKPETQKAVFGYQDRYNEYRHAMSKIHGDFRKTMDYWHLARQFDSLPVLNASFVKAQPSKRIFAEQTSNCLWVMAKHNLKALRCMPKKAQTKIM